MITILVLIYVVFISLGLPDSVFGVAWPVVHTEFGVAESFASIYSIITGVCTGGASFVAGVVLRKFGTPRVTFASILMTAVGLLGMSFSPNIWVMMACAVVMGYGAGAIDTGLNNYVSLHFKARHMSWLHAFWGIGVTLSPMIMSAFLDGGTGSWRKGCRVIALLQFAIAGAVGILLPKWRKLDDQKAEKAEQPTGKKPNLFAAPGLVPSILSLGFYCSMEFIVGTWGASYAVHVFCLTPATAAKWVSVYFGGIMTGRVLSGFVSDRLGDNRMIRIGAAASAVGIAVLLLPLGQGALMGFFFIGLGFGPVFPSVLHAVPARFGAAYSADLTGFHMSGAYAVGFAFQLALGYTATATTFRIVPWVLAGLLLCMAACHERAISRCKQGKQPTG